MNRLPSHLYRLNLRLLSAKTFSLDAASHIMRISRRFAESLVLTLSLATLFALTFCLGCTKFPGSPTEASYVWSRKGLDDGRFIKPRAIAIDQEDQIFVVDKTARIQVFDRDGNFIRNWRTPECYSGKPCGLGISQNNELMVCDTHYFRVLFYTREGEPLPDLTIGGVNGRGPGEFGFVTDVVQDSKGNFYVAEYGDFDRIQKFTPDREFVYQWGQHGEAIGQFQRPQGLAIDANDHLWVADSSNNRIQIFDVSGDEPLFVKTWGKPGQAVGCLSYPYNLVLDGKGHVYVCEYGNHRIQKFTLDGEPLGVWGSAGREPGQLNHPWSICRDSTGDFHIVDAANHRIQRFVFDE